MEHDELFQDKYRIKSARLENWDYSMPGGYFVTICTKYMIHRFGEVVDAEMRLNDLGRAAKKCWLEIPAHFPFVALDEFVIMPNHVQGIIQIIDVGGAASNYGRCKDVACRDVACRDVACRDVACRDVACNVSTGNTTSLKQNVNTFASISPRRGSLSSVVRSYKSACTNEIRKKIPNVNFAWQERFYDRIIRDEKALNAIRRYIRDNPRQWARDRNNLST